MLWLSFTVLLCAYLASARGARGDPVAKRVLRTGLQDIVTWDEYSLMINGERVFIFSGEVHPYRQPVQSLHLDVLQKIKSMGFNAVSFYIFWGILEPKRGELSFEGFRDLQPFIDAAKEAGLYLIARPGPYINAETAGGGFPGWGTRTPGLWRTINSTYIDAYQNYLSNVGGIIAKNQITNGGPVILFQAENEYSGFQPPYTEDFDYEARLLQDIREAGITVPITFNDAWPGGHYTSVDIYGYDSYPNGFDCANPSQWQADAVPEYFWDAHLQFTPNVPNAVYEFQGGAFDGWGGAGYQSCSLLLGPEFERVFYKNQYAMSMTIFNVYMIFGGTNWGGIAHPGVYSSYDYGAAIAEDRTLREKYYELKLQANFLAVSPAFLTTRPINIFASQGSFTGNSALKTTQVLDVVGNRTGFYVVRQTDASTNALQTYKLTVPTSAGQLTIPTLGGKLALNGKDSKIHVVDYDAGSASVLYSTGEIMTWAEIDGKTVILIYGNAGELHETAFKFDTTPPTASVLSGPGTIAQQTLSENSLVLQYTTTGQTVVSVGSNVVLFILDRTNAYQFWVLHLPDSSAFPRFNKKNPIIIKGGYLLRSVDAQGSTLAIKGDLNATSTFEIIAPSAITKSVTFNGDRLSLSKTSYGTLKASKSASLPEVSVPNLASATWKTAGSLPEISAGYSDALWTVANLATTENPTQPNTSFVLYASEYGFHTGNILWRAHFNATGAETAFKADVWGGSAFGYSVWLDSIFIGSWEGDAIHSNYDGTFQFPTELSPGTAHVITVLQDHMGLEENWAGASDYFKMPRGIVSYSFVDSPDTEVSIWKVAGNLGGEDYVDKARGPLNEGGLFAERQGWHLPGFNDRSWSTGNPTAGINQAGVAFYRTTFSLNIPSGLDYPLSIVVGNSTVNPHFRSQASVSNFRAFWELTMYHQFYVNGYQFGKYVNHIGPQTSFPIPQGILNYKGTNTLGVSLWAADAAGARLSSINLRLTSKVQSSMATVVNQPSPQWTQRPGAF